MFVCATTHHADRAEQMVFSCGV